MDAHFCADNYSWRWIFYINLPVGILTLFLVLRMVEDPPYVRGARGAGIHLDYIGIALLTTGIAALQVMLDRGQQDDWFGSRNIVTLAVIAAVCLVVLAVWEWFQKEPIIQVKLFKNYNYALANLMMFILGVLLFSSLVMMPLFLQTLMGYTAEKAGLVLSVSGVVLLIEMPVVGQLTTRIPARYIIGFGWLALAFGMYYSTQRIDLWMSFRSAAWLRVAQAAGLGFLFVPITMAGYIGVAPEHSNSVAGMINFMRNVGSSVGTSMVTTLLARRAQFHQSVLSYHTTQFDPAFRDQVAGLARQLARSGATAPDAHAAAIGRLYRGMLLQAQTLWNLDTFIRSRCGRARRRSRWVGTVLALPV